MKHVKKEPEGIGKELCIETQTTTRKEGDQVSNQVDTESSEKRDVRPLPLEVWFPGGC
jgi:hypothetical protein